MSGRTFLRALIKGSMRPDRCKEPLDSLPQLGDPAGDQPQIYGDVPFVHPHLRAGGVDPRMSGMASRAVHGGRVTEGPLAGDSQGGRKRETAPVPPIGHVFLGDLDITDHVDQRGPSRK